MVGHHGVSNHWCLDRLFTNLFMLTTTTTIIIQTNKQTKTLWKTLCITLPMDSFHQGTVIRKTFPCHGVIVKSVSAVAINTAVDWFTAVHHALHYSDVIMSGMASQITGNSIVYSTVCSGVDQGKHQNSASLTFVRGTHRWPVNSPHKGPVMRKMFPFDDVIVGNGNDDSGLKKFCWWKL